MNPIHSLHARALSLVYGQCNQLGECITSLGNWCYSLEVDFVDGELASASLDIFITSLCNRVFSRNSEEIHFATQLVGLSTKSIRAC